MKIKTIWFIAILLIGATIFINLSLNKENEDFDVIKMNVGDVFDKLDYKNTMYIINYMIEDVTGDNEKDIIIAVGEKETVDNIMASNVDIVIYNPVNKIFEKVGLKNLNGQNPKIFSSDLTSDGIKDIIIILDDEVNLKKVRAITISNDSLKEIFGEKDNRGLVFTGEIIDGLKAYLKCRKINKEMYIDLSAKKNEYITSKRSDESGKIICENKKISTTGFNTIEIVELNGQAGIRTTQKICGFDSNDIIDEITVIWKYENNKWQMKEAKGLKIGNLIY